MTDETSSTESPLPFESLGPAVQKVAGVKVPAAVRMMAARGLSPMAPRDLVTAQFVLTFDADEKIRGAAQNALRELDARIANAVLSDTQVNPLVLGYLAKALAANDSYAERILLNPKTPTSAFVDVALVSSEAICEIIANNQARVLEEPEIARSLSKNGRALKSTIDRVVDFLVRSSVFVDGVHEFEEALLRLTGAERLAAANAVALPLDLLDDSFLSAEEKAATRERQMIEEDEDGELPDDLQQTLQQRMRNMTAGMKVALATKGNKSVRNMLMRDTNRIVALAAISAPAITENEVIQAAQSRTVHQDVINYIARQKDWTKLYPIKLALTQNPKTLLPTAMRILPLLQKKDIKVLAKSKNVAMGVRNLASKLVKESSS